jgi:cytochrome o ubiquinol oxidase operon protein cyoD
MKSGYVPHASHGELRDYIIGYSSALVLTAVPFIVVLTGALSGGAAIAVIALFALAQIVVHLLFFLRLHRATDEPFKLAIFLYTLIILAILVGASIWIMHHLDAYHMVP